MSEPPCSLCSNPITPDDFARANVQIVPREGFTSRTHGVCPKTKRASE